MNIVVPEQNSHWYTHEGIAVHNVPCKSRPGEYRPTTLRDAKKADPPYLPSVTSILKVLNKDALEVWKLNQAILAALTLPREPGETEDAFARRIVDDMKAQSRKAAQRGTELHDLVERLVSLKAFEIRDPEIKALFFPVKEWIEENVEEVICAEKVLVNPVWGYAGTVDLIAVLKDLGPCVIDFKTASKEKPVFYDEWALQLEAYRDAVDFSGLALGVRARRYYKLVSVIIPSETPGVPLVKVWDEDPRRLEAFSAALTLWKWTKNF